MRRWQHEDTGRICEAVYCPGNRWYEIPGFEAEIKTSQESISDPLPAERFPVNYCFTTLRDYFAGLALKVILATGKRELTFHQVADFAYKQADAMIEVRER